MGQSYALYALNARQNSNYKIIIPVRISVPI